MDQHARAQGVCVKGVGEGTRWTQASQYMRVLLTQVLLSKSFSATLQEPHCLLSYLSFTKCPIKRSRPLNLIFNLIIYIGIEEYINNTALNRT